jgi:aerobic carbon-monoxide dehydrogenase medium subunit
VKPALFEYHDPVSISEVTQLLAEHGDDCKPLAGGQSLIPMLALRLAHFPHIVDINGVAELKGIEDRHASISIGAVVRQSEVEKDTMILEKLPLLAHASSFIGHFQIRNRGTIGGSLAHADAAAEYPAVALALWARVEVHSASGSRHIDAQDLFEGLWTTTLRSDEILSRVEFPVPTVSVTNGFDEIARRPGDFATAGAAVQLEWDDGTITGGRLSLFGVGARPTLRSAEELGLVGSTASSADIAGAVSAATSGLNPSSDIHGSSAYRVAAAGLVARNALESAVIERQE